MARYCSVKQQPRSPLSLIHISRIPGIDSVNVADAWKVLAGEQQVYGTVAVIGGGMVGCETAEYLAARGCKVSVIEMMDKIAAGESSTILPTLLENYKTYGVEQYPSHKVKEFRMDAVVCENKDGAEEMCIRDRWPPA